MGKGEGKGTGAGAGGGGAVNENNVAMPCVCCSNTSECCMCNESCLMCSRASSAQAVEQGVCFHMTACSYFCTQPQICCSGTYACCGFPNFPIEGAPAYIMPDISKAIMCCAYGCGMGMCNMSDFRSMCGCSAKGESCCFTVQSECCTCAKDEASKAAGKCIICCSGTTDCKSPKVCIKGHSQCFCVDYRCAFPCDKEVPCAVAILGCYCCYAMKPHVGCKPPATDAAVAAGAPDAPDMQIATEIVVAEATESVYPVAEMDKMERAECTEA